MKAAIPEKLNTIHHDDCIRGMDALPARIVDLAFADPPFNIGYDYDAYHDRKAADEYLDWSRKWISAVLRVLKPDGTFWLAIGDEYAAELKVLCTRELGLHCRSWVVWYYTFGVHCKNKFTRSHAHLFQFVRDPKRFTFNVDAIRVPSARQLVYADKRAVPKGRTPDDTWILPPAPAQFVPDATTDSSAEIAPVPTDAARREGFILRPQDLPAGFAPDSDTWYFSRVAGTFAERRGWHGCQMPEQLLGRIIRACSNENELVLDPFSGSATTLAVARKLRRRFVGFELSANYVKQGLERLAFCKPGDPLIGPESPLHSAPRTSQGRTLKDVGKRKRARAVSDAKLF